MNDTKGKIVSIIFSIILIFTSCNQKDNSSIENINETELENELRTAVQKVWEDANNRNIQGLKSAHLDSPKFSKFGPRNLERQNVEETNQTETEHFSAIKDVNLAIEDLKIDIFGKVGIATFYNNYSFIKNEKRIKGKGRVTLVFLRIDEGWKIVHEHSSPFNE